METCGCCLINRPICDAKSGANRAQRENRPGIGGLRALDIYRSINAMTESVIGLFKTELHRNRAALAANGGPWARPRRP